MATTMQRTRRPADAAKWAELFGKAVREGVEVRQTGSGLWIATSGTNTGSAYVVTLGDCECRAGLKGDRVCKHRAALRVRLGGFVVRGGTITDPLCTGHAVCTGGVVCGCPGCQAPPAIRPRPAREGATDRIAA